MGTHYDLVPSPRFLQGFTVNRGQAAGLNGCVFRANGIVDRGRDCVSILKLSVSRNGCPTRNTTRASKIRRVAGQRGLETQFAPQPSQAKQSAAEQRNCRAAIRDSRRSNADVVQKEEASSAKLYHRKGARGGEIKRVLGVARWPCKNMIENC